MHRPKLVLSQLVWGSKGSNRCIGHYSVTRVLSILLQVWFPHKNTNYKKFHIEKSPSCYQANLAEQIQSCITFTAHSLISIGHVNIQSCLLIIFKYQPISLQYSWLSVESQLYYFDSVMYKHNREFPLQEKIIQMVTCLLKHNFSPVLDSVGTVFLYLKIKSSSDCTKNHRY